MKGYSDNASRGDAEAEFFRLNAADVKELLVLERECFTCPWSEEQYRLAFDRGVFSVFGLRAEGELLAYVSLYHAAGEMEILNLATASAHRRRGLARRLLGIAIGIGGRMGMEYMFLEVRESNTPARSLYDSLGFERVGVRKKYYPDTGEDAIVMRRELSRAACPADAPAEPSSGEES